MPSHVSNPIAYLMNLLIMPILSDPTSKDTDGNGIGDTTCDDCYKYFEGENGIYNKYKIE